MTDSGRIRPTAHYTGYVWARNGLSAPALSTGEGRLLYDSLRPAMAASRLLGGGSLEPYLLARHLAIDALLERAIEGGITQVIEVACGLSPRGWRFANRYRGRLTYVEGDLPEMASLKRQALARLGASGEQHRVEVLDALLDDGPTSLASVAATLDPDRGLAIVTEGLVGYLDRDAVVGIWRRSARTLSRHPHGRYISDLHVGEAETLPVRVFRVFLSAFVRGHVQVNFETAAEAEGAVLAAGFRSASVRRATELTADAQRGPGSELAHILEASIE